MIWYVILTVALVGLIVPFMTLYLLRGGSIARLLRGEKDSASYSYDDLRGCLERIQAEITETYDRDDDKIVSFRFQGGHFYAIYMPSRQHASISFFNCFETTLENIAIVEQVVGATNNRNTPIKATYAPNDDHSMLEVSFHSSGLRLLNSRADAEYLIDLLTTFFDLQRLFVEAFNEQLEGNGNPLIRNSMPPVHSAYVIHRSELEESGKTWDGPWFEMPRLTLSEMIDRISGNVPSDDAQIIINGVSSTKKASEIEPLKILLKEDINSEDPVITENAFIDVIEQDKLTHRDTHVILRLTNTDDRLYTINAYVMQSGLPANSFRPTGSPETLPRAFSSTIGIHRGGPEIYKAEAEYMAEEQDLVNLVKSGDAAYSLYWGKVLFTSDRFFEASFYLQNAYDLLAPQMNNPSSQPQELLEQFFDICFFLSVSFYKLGRYRDSYYYIDIIFQQHRVRWTEQYILTLVALRDPRLEVMMTNLRDQLVEQLNDEDAGPHIQKLIDFIDRQMILVKIQQGKIDEARQALEKQLEASPDDSFALYWLAKLG
ncbi:MAG: tetratricopeptide repeat protein [Muribaculaceae bacterium]|nr:tetratricopeptide repeat protein [Muribaculaceae bacterium]